MHIAKARNSFDWRSIRSIRNGFPFSLKSAYISFMGSQASGDDNGKVSSGVYTRDATNRSITAWAIANLRTDTFDGHRFLVWTRNAATS